MGHDPQHELCLLEVGAVFHAELTDAFHCRFVSGTVMLYLASSRPPLTIMRLRLRLRLPLPKSTFDRSSFLIQG